MYIRRPVCLPSVRIKEETITPQLSSVTSQSQSKSASQGIRVSSCVTVIVERVRYTIRQARALKVVWSLVKGRFSCIYQAGTSPEGSTSAYCRQVLNVRARFDIKYCWSVSESVKEDRVRLRTYLSSHSSVSFGKAKPSQVFRLSPTNNWGSST